MCSSDLLTRDEKAELISVVAEQAERDGTINQTELNEIQKNLKKRVPDLKNLPYQIEIEIIDALNNLLPTRGNIMPVYVNAKNIFDYANKDDVNQVYQWMMHNSSATGRMQNPDQWLNSVKGLISRGNWNRIESEPVQEAIRALGFDGFSVLEAGTKNYAVYNPTQIKSVTGNIGTWGLGEVTTEQAQRFGMTADQARKAQEEGDIRFSLRKAPASHPLLMYHSTFSDFTTPKTNYGDNEYKQWGFHVGSIEAAENRLGIKENEDAREGVRKGGAGANIMPVYIQAKNPLRLNETRTGRWGVDDIMNAVMEKAEKSGIEGISDEEIGRAHV